MHRSVKQNWKQLPSYSFGGLTEERRNSRVDPTKVTPPDDQDEGAKLMLGGADAKGRKPPTCGHERGQRGILIPARQLWPARLPGAEILKATPEQSFCLTFYAFDMASIVIANNAPLTQQTVSN